MITGSVLTGRGLLDPSLGHDLSPQTQSVRHFVIFKCLILGFVLEIPTATLNLGFPDNSGSYRKQMIVLLQNHSHK